MTLFPIEIPAGVYTNGTDLDARGRWRDANFVRWEDNSLRPIGGWSLRKSAAVASAPRGMIAWEDNSGNRWIGIGTHDALNVMNAAGTVSDISPTSLVAGLEDAAYNLGYGAGPYGSFLYGVPRVDAGSPDEAAAWSVDTWGEYLVACSPADGRLVEWQLNTGVAAAALSNAPTDCLGLVVTAERFLFGLGAGGDPRLVQWCDREDNTTWADEITNEAGSQQLQTTGLIMAGSQVRGGTMILTTTDAWLATYLGPPFVYGFERVGSSCGVAGRRAFASVEGNIYWMGRTGFFQWAGGGVEPLDCDVWDTVFEDINEVQRSKVWAVPNSQFGEVWFFYPSGESIEIDRYVSYNYRAGIWSIGALDRTAGFDVGVYSTPIWAESDGTIYNHEGSVPPRAEGDTPYAETGPISPGEVFTARELIPDEGTQGRVQATFKTRFYPNGDETTHGPYTLENPTDVRFTGRQMRLRVTQVTPQHWTFGTPRVRISERGQR